jgi:hypothetical protein
MVESLTVPPPGEYPLKTFPFSLSPCMPRE